MKLTEKQVTAEAARSLRESLGLSQKAFWEPLGVLQSVGCTYESGTKIPKSVRILLVARYVAGLNLDTSSVGGVEAIEALSTLQNGGNLSVNIATASARKALKTATDLISKAQAALGRI